MSTDHNHSTRANMKRVHGDTYEFYEPAVRGCEKCKEAARIKNQHLYEVAHYNFTKKQMNHS